MWEESRELDLDADRANLVFMHPLFKDRIDQIIVFGILVCSALIMISALKVRALLRTGPTSCAAPSSSVSPRIR